MKPQYSPTRFVVSHHIFYNHFKRHVTLVIKINEIQRVNGQHVQRNYNLKVPFEIVLPNGVQPSEKVWVYTVQVVTKKHDNNNHSNDPLSDLDKVHKSLV